MCRPQKAIASLVRLVGPGLPYWRRAAIPRVLERVLSLVFEVVAVVWLFDNFSSQEASCAAFIPTSYRVSHSPSFNQIICLQHVFFFSIHLVGFLHRCLFSHRTPDHTLISTVPVVPAKFQCRSISRMSVPATNEPATTTKHEFSLSFLAEADQFVYCIRRAARPPDPGKQPALG